MARQPSLTHTLGRHISQRGQEEQAVLPSPCHCMDHRSPNASAPVERPPSHRVSPLELGGWPAPASNEIVEKPQRGHIEWTG